MSVNKCINGFMRVLRIVRACWQNMYFRCSSMIVVNQVPSTELDSPFLRRLSSLDLASRYLT